MGVLRTVFLCISTIGFSIAFSDLDDAIYSSKSSDDYVPCDRGWYYFRDKCYTVTARTVSMVPWTRALDMCRGYGADLASIQSQEEQDFIVAYLQLNIKWWAWIGLNDRDTEGDFKWTDGSALNYTNWEPYEPSGHGREHAFRDHDEDCVHVVYKPEIDVLGEWNDRICDSPEYALCEKKANPKKKSPNPIYCSPDEGGGWKYENSCFHIVLEEKPWKKAAEYCKRNYNGHLLTLPNTLQDFFIELALPHTKKEIWIGIKIEEQLQQKWTTGWYVSYDRFSKEERYLKDTCVARKSRKEWITVPCTHELPFICEVSKGDPPVLQPPPTGARCPKDMDDWRDLGGEYCYYIETTKSVNFCEANFDCQSRGGHLVSLHSQEETDILKPFIEYKLPFYVHIFIGLIRFKANHEEAFGWTDGSELLYKNWNHNEPNRIEEKCVSVQSRSMKWHDVLCGNELQGYICSVKKIVPSTVTSNLIAESSKCANFCVAPTTYLFGVLSQCPEAIRIS